MRRLISVFALAAILLPALAANISTTFDKPSPQRRQQQKPRCTDNGTYTNSKGETVKRPENCSAVPQGATAQCADGTYSFSQSRRGTCSFLTTISASCLAIRSPARAGLAPALGSRSCVPSLYTIPDKRSGGGIYRRQNASSPKQSAF
jgi:hypothetical protein